MTTESDAQMYERLTAELADRYRLEAEIGRGGMAIVYRALDLRHRRPVALKVLRPEISETVGAERFLREIEIVAGLTHPHILPVHDSGEAAGQLYFVMPWIDGESLRERLARDGRLDPETATRIGAEVADALDYAHRHGVVHRDVKPGNILLSDGHCFVADFGVARAVDPVGTTTLTGTGLVVGTPHYMSPEQASGTRELDARTDVYALGCVLHEMLAGTPPFDGPTAQAILAKRLTEDPPPIRRLRRDVPPDLERTLLRALAREPGARFATSGQLRDALEAETGAHRSRHRAASLARRTRHALGSRLRGHPVLAALLGAAALGVVWAAWTGLGTIGGPPGGESLGETGPPGAAGPNDMFRVAVLPLRVVGTDSSRSELDAIGDGVVRDLVHRLRNQRSLRVPSMLEVEPLARRLEAEGLSPLDSLSRRFGTPWVLNGDLMGDRDSIRVRLELHDMTSGQVTDLDPVWAERHALIHLSDLVAQRVDDQLSRTLGREFRLRELRAQTSSNTAWRRAAEAEGFLTDAETLRNDGERERATEVLGRADSAAVAAASEDPGWAEPQILAARIALARALVQGDSPGEFGREDRPELERALGHLADALKRDSLSADAWALQGYIELGLSRIVPASDGRSGTWREQARLSLDRALQIDRHDVEALLARASLAEDEGDARAQVAYLERAYEADRWSTSAYSTITRLVAAALEAEDSVQAVHWASVAAERWPDRPATPYVNLMVQATLGGTPDSARRLVSRIPGAGSPDRVSEFHLVALADYACVLARAGMQDSARNVLTRVVAGAHQEGIETSVAYNVAHAWAVLGDRNRAVEWLAIDLQAYPGERETRAREIWFRSLHGFPPFDSLVSTAGTD